MWRCKKCGGTKFYENIIGGSQISVFDENGDCIESEDVDIEYGEIQCTKCDNSGDEIQDIAERED